MQTDVCTAGFNIHMNTSWAVGGGTAQGTKAHGNTHGTGNMATWHTAHGGVFLDSHVRVCADSSLLKKQGGNPLEMEGL